MWKLKRRTISVSLVLQLIIIFNLIVLQSASHITGSFRTNEFFKLIAKFGFQKTERHSLRDSYGYIYGNITSTEHFPVKITFALLDRYNFLPFYSNHELVNRDIACQRMFSSINQFAYDIKCHPKKDGLDFLRRVPCTELCTDEDTSSNVIQGHQFTYAISDLNQPRYGIVCVRHACNACNAHHKQQSFKTQIKSFCIHLLIIINQSSSGFLLQILVYFVGCMLSR